MRFRVRDLKNGEGLWPSEILGKLKHAPPLAAIVLLLLAVGGPTCAAGCDVARPEAMAATECQLCRLAEAQPAEPQFSLSRTPIPPSPTAGWRCRGSMASARKTWRA